MAVEPPLNINEYKEWRYKQIMGLKIIEDIILELICD